MSTTTPPVARMIVLPAWARNAFTPLMRALLVGVEPPGRKLLSGEVTIRSGGTQLPCPPARQSPYWTLKEPLGSCVASPIAMPSKEPPSQYTGNGAAIRPSRMLCGIGLSCTVFAHEHNASEHSTPAPAPAPALRSARARGTRALTRTVL